MQVNGDSLFIGKRITDEKYFGTICYIGSLPNSSETWLGIDWDDSSRGRHDGTFNGIQYFKTHESNSGSFVRPKKVVHGISFEESLIYRYVFCAECQIKYRGLHAVLTEDSNKTNDGYLNVKKYSNYVLLSDETKSDSANALSIPVKLFTPSTRTAPDLDCKHTLCGPLGVQSALSVLRCVDLSFEPISHTMYGFNQSNLDEPTNESSLWLSTYGSLDKCLTNITELALTSCLLSTWIDVANICIQLPSLKVLNVSGNRLRLPLDESSTSMKTKCDANADRLLAFDCAVNMVDSRRLFAEAFGHVIELAMVRCQIIDWNSVRRIVQWMPSLKQLTLAHNNLGNSSSNWDAQMIRSFQDLTQLDLTSTGMTNVEHLCAYIGPSANLKTLFLPSNQIGALPDFGRIDDTWFANLNHLSINDNLFADWNFVFQLLQLPHLTYLSLDECPLKQTMTFETFRQELIARLPQLRYLNRVEIAPSERRGAELDYLKRYGALWMASCSTNQCPVGGGDQADCQFGKIHPTFFRLCEKYGPPELGETKVVTCSLKQDLILLKMAVDGCQPTSTLAVNIIEKSIHSHMTIGHLKLMFRRLFRLPAKTSFDLVAKSQQHWQEIMLDADTREVGFYDLENGDTVYARIQSSSLN